MKTEDDIRNRTTDGTPDEILGREWMRHQFEELEKCNTRTELVYSAMIPLNPMTKKNSQKIITNPKTKRPMIVQSDKFRQYERDAGWFLRTPAKPIDYPVNVRVIFYRDSARRVDLTNLLEAIDDLLVDNKILKDDNFEIIAGHDGSRVYIDREKPRTEIYIEHTEIYIEHIQKYNKKEEADS